MAPSANRVTRRELLKLSPLLAFGAFVYFVPSNAPNIAYNAPPSTTGQGTPRTMAPVVDEVRVACGSVQPEEDEAASPYR